jgi:hypothetical protein
MDHLEAIVEVMKETKITQNYVNKTERILR